ncbi:MAG: 1-acyl-sn-glycerol-3-phosphate acyltransferase [Mycobacteriaceae bacterium]|nr:1-acyl-sn-glycerol-3-phosphate acyltransferase [Mycobacteriaceae bacterium]
MTHAWLPRASCDCSCVRLEPVGAWGGSVRLVRAVVRVGLVLAVLPISPVLFIPHPGRSRSVRLYCRLVLRCMGVRITKSGGPIRNVPGVLVVSPHMSWVDTLVINALMPGAFVAKAELIGWPGIGLLARAMNVIPIDRARLRRLPDVVDTVAQRLRSGQTVVAFPEGTTWCGLAHGPFRPAMFQAAIDAGRPVQPLRLSYHRPDGRPSTIPAYVGKDNLLSSFLRVVSGGPIVAHVSVEELQLPGTHRRDLAERCQQAVGEGQPSRHEHALAA